MKKSFLLVGLFAASAATPVLAANANHPYANCDRKVDNCAPTGNETTDQLNAQQLGNSGQPPMGQPPMGQQMMGQPPMDQQMNHGPAMPMRGAPRP